MKFSYKWLRELSGTEKSAEEVAALLTTHSFEVEDVTHLDAGMDNVVVGHVMTRDKHPDADRLSVATVDVGGSVPLTIVCGAPNLATGQKVAVALAGAVLPTADGKGFAIKKSTIRGVESNGMICAEDELGLGTDHAGIMVLGENAPVGTPFAVYRGLDDAVLEIDVLPNRAYDCLSHVGMAREIAAAEGRTMAPLASDETIATLASGLLTVSVATDVCRRYMGIVIEEVDNTVATPLWMTARLAACGIGSINPVVDITNYVMLETGQPLHAFDADNIAVDGTVAIGVRTAAADEKLTILNGTELSLASDDTVITAADRPVALAGVMGGQGSGVASTTTRIVLEAAMFDATAIRATRVRHDLATDAAYRFERAPDVATTAEAGYRAAALIRGICGGRTVACVDTYPAPATPQTIVLHRDAVTRLLGVVVPDDDIVAICTNLGLAATVAADAVTVTVPLRRKDLTTEEDLIEEIGRLYGYSRIASAPLAVAVERTAPDAVRTMLWTIQDAAVGAGFTEVKGYAFHSVDDATASGVGDAAHVALINPMNADQAVMRRTLVPSLARACRTTLRTADTCALFEIGKLYHPHDDTLPQEAYTVGAAVAAKGTDGAGFYQLKGFVDAAVRAAGVGVCTYDDAYAADDLTLPALHGGRRAIVRAADGTALGMIGELPAQCAKYFGIKHARVTVCQLDIAALVAATRGPVTFVPLPTHPVSQRDVSMTIGARTQCASVVAVARRALAAWESATHATVRDITVFDTYVSADGERSMAMRMTLGAADRTLAGAEIDAAVAAVVAAVEQGTEARVRQ